jgi:hypothetical protein
MIEGESFIYKINVARAGLGRGINWTTLDHTGPHWTTLDHTASTLQRTATHFNTLSLLCSTGLSTGTRLGS